MIEFNDKRDINQYEIIFPNQEKILLDDKNFIITGNVSNVAVQLAKYLYNYSRYDYNKVNSHTHAEAHQFTAVSHNIKISFGSLFKPHIDITMINFKNKDFKIEMIWNGKHNAQWVEFNNVFERYFNLKSFL